jgi:electron transport complex protein RnfD
MTLKQDMLQVSYPPHIHSGESVHRIMWTVFGALAPACAYSVYHFGKSSLVIIIIAVISAVIAEALIELLLRRPVTVLDGSAAVTGLLLGMNLPPHAPPWMAAIGSFFAVIIVKQLFGGLGFNIFNPALAARALLMASWPVYMTTKWHRFSDQNILSPDIKNTYSFLPSQFDALTQATPLALLKDGPKVFADNNIAVARLYDIVTSPDMIRSLFIGSVGGVIGETSAMLLLAGALVLLFRKIITWHVPVSFLGTVALFTMIYYFFAGVPAFHLMALFHCLSGGLFLGAFFMATDPVTSPVTTRGMLVFGSGCGLITCIIRFWGGYPEGVSYAILIMNAFVPLIDRFARPRVFGTRPGKWREKAH